MTACPSSMVSWLLAAAGLSCCVGPPLADVVVRPPSDQPVLFAAEASDGASLLVVSVSSSDRPALVATIPVAVGARWFWFDAERLLISEDDDPEELVLASADGASRQVLPQPVAGGFALNLPAGLDPRPDRLAGVEEEVVVRGGEIWRSRCVYGTHIDDVLLCAGWSWLRVYPTRSTTAVPRLPPQGAASPSSQPQRASLSALGWPEPGPPPGVTVEVAGEPGKRYLTCTRAGRTGRRATWPADPEDAAIISMEITWRRHPVGFADIVTEHPSDSDLSSEILMEWTYEACAGEVEPDTLPATSFGPGRLWATHHDAAEPPVALRRGSDVIEMPKLDLGSLPVFAPVDR